MPKSPEILLIEEATNLAEQAFGEPPVGVWCAPGRVNLIGEHVDYNGGVSIPMALPQRTCVAASPRSGTLLRAVSTMAGEVVEVDLATFPEGEGSWLAYVAGAVKSLADLGLAPLQGMDVAIASTVPLGAGLSSSAALECAVALAAVDLGKPTETYVTSDEDERRELVAQACVRAENVYAGAATGGMDQAASLRAKDGHALAFDARTGKVSHVPLDLDALGYTVLVIDTQVSHSLGDGQYENRRNASETAARTLQVDFLADVDVEDLDKALEQLDTKELKARAKHVITEVARTKRFQELLQNPTEGALEQIGALMDASHESLAKDYEVSCEELDVATEVARSFGAVGARMTGGGFGGSAIALVPNAKVEAVEAGIAEAFAQNGFKEPLFIEAIPSAPASRVL